MNEKLTGIIDFEWPAFKTESERIKHFSKIYRESSIAEAFGIKDYVEQTEATYYECEPGDVVYLKILKITKKEVVFDQGNIKDTIVCNTNLYQYDKFKEFIPTKPIPCKVISNFKGKITVDPFAVMIKNFIADRSTNLELQYNVKLPKPVTVENLRLTKGGYFGAIKIPALSDFVGKPMYVEAFIPGSQIVQNVESDFTKWEGQSKLAFITNYINKPNSTDKIFICSPKEWLNFEGQCVMIDLFKNYCDDNEEWKNIQEKSYKGIITGICNTAKKCGVFVEIPEKNITALAPCDREVINTFLKGREIDVKIKDFEIRKFYNKEVDQMQTVEPYIIKNDILVKFNLRLILDIC